MGIYVHWPFCAKKCPYCDFNSHVRAAVDHERWRASFLREIGTAAALFPHIRPATIFFGGGTPSLMEPETTAAIISAVKSHWPNHDPHMEITLEANPSSVEAGRFQAYAQAGVNRLSMGIQSLRNDSLAFLGRLHDANAARTALDVAKSTFSRVSFDLIYALPDQSPAQWAEELEEALAIAPDHLSLYQLTLEPGTGFWAQAQRGRLTLPDDDLARILFDQTQERMMAANMPAYETSNHAITGQESRHNLIYWQGGGYLGFGPGAHGRTPVGNSTHMNATSQIKKPERWLDKVAQRGWGGDRVAHIDAEERMIERLMMGLRLTKGIDLGTLKCDLSLDPWQYISRTAAHKLMDMGLLHLTGSQLRLSREGQPLLNTILAKLLI